MPPRSMSRGRSVEQSRGHSNTMPWLWMLVIESTNRNSQSVTSLARRHFQLTAQTANRRILTMAQLHPGNRFLAVIVAQGLGVGLLFVIGLVFELFYKSAKPIAVEEGVEYLWSIDLLVLFVLVVGFLLGFIPARCKKAFEFEDAWVDWTV